LCDYLRTCLWQRSAVIELEAKLPDDGLTFFSPSGTMANQTAIKLHTQPGEQLADKLRMYIIMKVVELLNSGVSCCLLDGNHGMITAEQVQGVIRNYHSPLTSLVCVRKYNNKVSGACYERKICKNQSL
jgi:threonine aldolase